MTAAELASFRSLLQAQAESRRHARGSSASPTRPAWPQAAARWELDPGVPAPAAPPPSRPSAFGRRSPTDLAAPPAPAEPEDPLVRSAPAWTAPLATPDVAPERAPRPAPPGGRIAGWSHVRPPSAQKRVLARLEAVFIAEREGLEARRAGVAPG